MRDVLRQSSSCSAAGAVWAMQSVRDVLRQRAKYQTVESEAWMQSVRDVLRQRSSPNTSSRSRRDAIRAGCSETNGRSLYSNDHAQNNEVNRKES